MTLEDLKAEIFQPWLGSRFQIQLGASSDLALILAECVTAGMAPAGSSRAPFRLLFHGPLRPVLPQAIYRLVHEEMGALDIFIVPIGPEGDSMRYEAIFT